MAHNVSVTSPVNAFLLILVIMAFAAISVFLLPLSAHAGQFTVDSCSSCHDLRPIESSLRNSPEGSIIGSHQVLAHKDVVLGTNLCTACHTGNLSYAHRNGLININTTMILNHTGSYYDKDNNAVKEGSDGAFSQNRMANATTMGTCRNLYCHSTAQGIADPTDAPVYNTPQWGENFGLCGEGKCHDTGAHIGGPSVFPTLKTGSHEKHMNFKYDQSGICAVCHYDWQNTGCTPCHTGGGAVFHRARDHPNKSIDVFFSEDFPVAGGMHGEGTYTGDPAPQTAYGQCSGIYCHSPGNKLDAPYDAPNDTPVDWGGSISGDCTACHGGDAGSAIPLASGSHLKHVQNTDCNSCHEYTVSNSRTYNPAEYGGQNYSYGSRYHVDGWVTVVYNSFVGSGTYNSSASPITTRAPGSTYGDCTNVYCHSNVQDIKDGTVTPTVYHTPTWGGSAPCGDCH